MCVWGESVFAPSWRINEKNITERNAFFTLCCYIRSLDGPLINVDVLGRDETLIEGSFPWI